MPNVRQAMFPYALNRNPDKTWTLVNRKYKPVGVITTDWAEYDDPRHKVTAKLTQAKLKKLDIDGIGEGDMIYLYNDATNLEQGGSNLKSYLDKLAILITL